MQRACEERSIARIGRLESHRGKAGHQIRPGRKSGAGSQIEAALNAARAYADWLKKTVGALQPKKRDVLDAIAALQVPIATCNYDGIIEAALEIPGITWRDHGMVTKFLRGGNGEAALIHFAQQVIW